MSRPLAVASSGYLGGSPLSIAVDGWLATSGKKRPDYFVGGRTYEDRKVAIPQSLAVGVSSAIARLRGMGSLPGISTGISNASAWLRLAKAPGAPALSVSSSNGQAATRRLLRSASAGQGTSNGHAVALAWGEPDEAVILALFAAAQRRRNKQKVAK